MKDDTESSRGTAKYSTVQEAQREALHRAKETAQRGDVVGYLEALHESHVLDGLKRTLGGMWWDVPAEDIDDILAEVTDEVYSQIVAGRRVSNLGGYLYKAAWYKLNDYTDSRRRAEPRGTGEEVAELVATGDALPVRADAAELDDEGLEPDDVRRKAIALARSLLPQLGLKNVQRVMSLILDAVEQGAVDLSTEEIAQALGLKPATVRVLRHRGFRRLRRLFEEKDWPIRLLELEGSGSTHVTPPGGREDADRLDEVEDE